MLYSSFCMYLSLCSLFCSLFCSACASAQPARFEITPATTPQVYITVKATSAKYVSAFSPGMTSVDTSLFTPWTGNDSQAVEHAKNLLKQGLSFFNVPIMGWGADDPWPDPQQPEPSNWKTLDTKMSLALQTETTPVLTLCEAPWWMKGMLLADGKTQLLSKGDDFAPIAYQSRILDNEMAAWLHLVRRVAERYMVSPYNVRYFQVWNELKGYYDPLTNNWDISTSPGNAAGPNARHGYTYMYNRVYQTLRDVARENGIAPSTISIGGPYVTMNTWSSSQQNHLSNLVKPYGIYDQRSLDAVLYWLQHKTGGQFIAVDGSNQNDDAVSLADPFTAAAKFADSVSWIRSLNEHLYPGATTLPIWWSEWYADPYDGKSSNDYANALKTSAIMQLIKSGGAVALSWGSDDLWTSTAKNTGGKPLPWYTSYAALKRYFAPGTFLISSASSSPQVDALASAKVTMLVNKTPHLLLVDVEQTLVALHPYQVLLTLNH